MISMLRRHSLKPVVMLVAIIGAANIPTKPGNPHLDKWRTGDVIFLNGTSLRSKIVRLVQGYSCDYSHVGLVVVDQGSPFVVNADPAEGKVVKQRWDVVVATGQISGGAVFRLRGVDKATINTACAMAERWAGENVPFDYKFDLKTADKLFCTELVLRAYRSAGLDLCKNAEVKHPYLLPADLLKSPQFEMVEQF